MVDTPSLSESASRPLYTRIRHRHRWPLMLIGLTIIILYGWSFRGVAGMDDEYVMLNVTANLVDYHTFALPTRFTVLYDLPADPQAPAMFKYGIGQSALGIPLYALGHLLPSFGTIKIGNETIPLGPYHLALFLDSFMTLFAMYGIIFTVQLLGYSWRTAALAGILYAVATVAWPYAKTYFSEPTTACFLIGHIYWLIRYRRVANVQSALISGLCLGIAILARTTSIILVPLSLLYLWPYWKRWLWPLIGITVCVALVLAYDQARYGSPFRTGYDTEWNFNNPVLSTLLGFTVSPTRGMFVFNPILLLIFPGAWLLWRQARRETLYLVVFMIGHTFLFSMWYFWDGGSSLASRFLVPLLPICAVLISPLMARPRWRPTLIGLGGLSFGLQILWNLTQFTPVAAQAGLPDMPDYYWTWNWGKSYILSAWPAYYKGGLIDSAVVQTFNIADPVVRALLFGAVAAILVGIALRMAIRLSNTPLNAAPVSPSLAIDMAESERNTRAHALAAR